MANSSRITISQVIQGNEIELITLEVPEGETTQTYISSLIHFIRSHDSIKINNEFTGIVISKDHGPVRVFRSPANKPLG